MSQETWTAVDEYITDLVVGHDDALEAAQKASSDAGLPPIAVSPAQGKLLQLLAQLVGAKHILEIGTLAGYSAIWLARALPADGSLITLEYDPKHADIARSNLANAGLTQKVDVRVGLALDTLPLIAGEKRPPFDLVFIDADKANNDAYFEWAMKLCRPGGLIVVDNVVRSGAVLSADSSDAAIQGIRRLNEAIAAEPRANATEIQTVGVKGYDGLAFIRIED